MQTKSIQKFITFSPELYRLATEKARRFGLSVGEYLRHLVVEDVKSEVEEYSMVDAQTNKDIGEALKEYKEEKYTTLKSPKEIEEHFNNL